MTSIIISSTTPSFVRRKGRLTSAERNALESLFPQFGLVVREAPIALDSLFSDISAPLIVEIGFGNGDNILTLAENNPHNNYIGIEVYEAGIAGALIGIEKRGLKNMRVVFGDAVLFLEKMLPATCIDKVLVFFPDPWHKKRHNKRRLIQTPFIDLLVTRFKKGGVLQLATDWQHYAEQMLEVLSNHPKFKNEFGVGQYANGPVDRIETRFERRGLKLGHGVWDLVFSMTE